MANQFSNISDGLVIGAREIRSQINHQWETIHALNIMPVQGVKLVLFGHKQSEQNITQIFHISS